MINYFTDFDSIERETKEMLSNALKGVLEPEEIKEYIDNLNIDVVMRLSNFFKLEISFECDALTYRLFCNGLNKTMSEAGYNGHRAQFYKYFE